MTTAGSSEPYRLPPEIEDLLRQRLERANAVRPDRAVHDARLVIEQYRGLRAEPRRSPMDILVTLDELREQARGLRILLDEVLDHDVLALHLGDAAIESSVSLTHHEHVAWARELQGNVEVLEGVAEKAAVDARRLYGTGMDKHGDAAGKMLYEGVIELAVRAKINIAYAASSHLAQIAAIILAAAENDTEAQAIAAIPDLIGKASGRLRKLLT
jgi:hypothetical protein